jgi:hypothetical protein
VTHGIEYDFGGRYQKVEGMRKPMIISGEMIGKVNRTYPMYHTYKYILILIKLINNISKS